MTIPNKYFVTEDVNREEIPKIENEFENIEKLISSEMVFTAHCANVDYDMFNYLYYQKHKRHFETMAVDTCQIARNVIGLKKCGIATIAEHFNYADGRHHDPVFDAFVAAQVLIKSLEIIQEDSKLKTVFIKNLKKFPSAAYVKRMTKKNNVDDNKTSVSYNEGC